MIPVCTPLLGGNEKKYLLDCVTSKWISSSGQYIRKFEEQFSGYCGARHGVAVTSGTTALHLAFAAVGIGKGDEVIMPDFNIASTAFAALYCGAKPVFVASKKDTWNIDPQRIEGVITRRAKAIVPVHIYGHPCDMDAVMRIARRHKLIVIEDAAEAHGAEYRGRKVGGIGDIGCFSFYGNKIITCGEGGMVVTGNQKWAERMRMLKNLSFLEEKRFWHKAIGFNYRMTNMQAALGLAQFEKIEEMVALRRRNAALYNQWLGDVPGLTLPAERPGVKNVYWMYGLLVGKPFAVSRDNLMKRLKEMGIESRTFFIPMHAQPVYEQLWSAGDFTNSDMYGRDGFYLPSSSHLSNKDKDFVIGKIHEFYKSK